MYINFLSVANRLVLLSDCISCEMFLQVEEYGQVFMEHANKLVEVANLACSMSSNEEGVKLVRLAASQLEALCPQVRKLTIGACRAVTL